MKDTVNFTRLNLYIFFQTPLIVLSVIQCRQKDHIYHSNEFEYLISGLAHIYQPSLPFFQRSSVPIVLMILFVPWRSFSSFSLMVRSVMKERASNHQESFCCVGKSLLS